MTHRSDGRLIVVDLSNLCRDERFLAPERQAEFRLLDSFTAGLSALGLADTSVHAVADRSLASLMTQGDRRRLKSLQDAGRLELTPLADELILDYAFGPTSDPETLVASLDNFDDFRRTYPQIQGSTDRFLGWEPCEQGHLVVVRRDMGVHDHQRLSRKEESEELKARRLRREGLVRRAASHYFRCVNRECLLAQLWPDRIPDLPRYDDTQDSFVCPSCTHALHQQGVRLAGVQVIVYLHGGEQFRLLIEEGDDLLIGRRESKGCIGLANRLPDGAAGAVSRRHVRLSFANDRLTVADLGSRNGTELRASGGAERLTAGALRVVGPRATIAFPGGITIERSGRSVPLDGLRPPQTGEEIDTGRVTRLLAPRDDQRG